MKIKSLVRTSLILPLSLIFIQFLPVYLQGIFMFFIIITSSNLICKRHNLLLIFIFSIYFILFYTFNPMFRLYGLMNFFSSIILYNILYKFSHKLNFDNLLVVILFSRLIALIVFSIIFGSIIYLYFTSLFIIESHLLIIVLLIILKYNLKDYYYNFLKFSYYSKRGV